MYACDVMGSLTSISYFVKHFQKQQGLLQTDIVEGRKVLEGVKGHLVTFPTHFLEQEQLRTTIRPLPAEVFF